MYHLNLPKKVYFKAGSVNVALRELTEVYHLERALLVSDARLYRAGTVKPVKLWLNAHGMRTAEVFSLDGTPRFEDIRKFLPKALEFQPDAIVGVGGGSVMSAAKALWALYENPGLDLAAAAKDGSLLHTGAKAQLFLAATSFGSGAQNSPWAVLLDDAGRPAVLQNQCLLPLISCTDADFALTLTPEQLHADAAKLLSLLLWGAVAEDCCEYSMSLLQEGVKLILENWAAAEAGRPEAREKLHNAGSLAGSACGNVTLPADPTVWQAPPPEDVLNKSPHARHLAKELGYDSTPALWKACRAVIG